MSWSAWARGTEGLLKGLEKLDIPPEWSITFFVQVRMSSDPPPTIPKLSDQEIEEFVQRWGLERSSASE